MRGLSVYEISYRGSIMKILADGDTCPVIAETEFLAWAYGVPMTILADTTHNIVSDYSEVINVSVGAEAMDVALIKRCRRGDIVVTQDAGLAAMAIGKRGYVINNGGWQYTDKNISGILNNKQLAKRKSRTYKQTKRFNRGLEALLRERILEQEELYWAALGEQYLREMS